MVKIIWSIYPNEEAEGVAVCWGGSPSNTAKRRSWTLEKERSGRTRRRARRPKKEARGAEPHGNSSELSTPLPTEPRGIGCGERGKRRRGEHRSRRSLLKESRCRKLSDSPDSPEKVKTTTMKYRLGLGPGEERQGDDEWDDLG